MNSIALGAWSSVALNSSLLRLRRRHHLWGKSRVIGSKLIHRHPFNTHGWSRTRASATSCSVAGLRRRNQRRITRAANGKIDLDLVWVTRPDVNVIPGLRYLVPTSLEVFRFLKVTFWSSMNTLRDVTQAKFEALNAENWEWKRLCLYSRGIAFSLDGSFTLSHVWFLSANVFRFIYSKSYRKKMSEISKGLEQWCIELPCNQL